MTTLFIDSDILLDVLLNRTPHAEPAAKILDMAHRHKIKLYTSGIILSNLYYILKDINKQKDVRTALLELRKIIRICKVDESIIDLALNSEWTDFEDAIQHHAALSISADALLTRNKKDYKKSKIPIFTAQEWITFFKP